MKPFAYLIQQKSKSDGIQQSQDGLGANEVFEDKNQPENQMETENPTEEVVTQETNREDDKKPSDEENSQNNDVMTQVVMGLQDLIAKNNSELMKTVGEVVASNIREANQMAVEKICETNEMIVTRCHLYQ